MSLCFFLHLYIEFIILWRTVVNVGITTCNHCFFFFSFPFFFFLIEYLFWNLNIWTSPKMFYLSNIEHTLRLPPHLLDLPLHDSIKGELEGLFLDKVSFNGDFYFSSETIYVLWILSSFYSGWKHLVIQTW